MTIRPRIKGGGRRKFSPLIPGVKVKGKLKKIIVMALIFLGFNYLQAIRITVNGTWIEIIDANDLDGPPGSDLRPFIESSPAQVLISILNTHRLWEVNISREDFLWPKEFQLYVRRTGDGRGPGTIQGGLAYLKILEVDQLFFSGSNQRLGIPLQFRLEGLSVDIPPGNYVTNIIYTVIEY